MSSLFLVVRCGSSLCLGPLGALEFVDLGEQGSGFVFERGLERSEIFRRELAGLVLEVQVAQVLIDDLAALAQVFQARLLRLGNKAALRPEDVGEAAEAEECAGERDHSSVS